MPESGGLRNQKAGELGRMTELFNIWQAHKRWKNTPPDKIANIIEQYPDENEIRSEVTKLRKEIGKK